MTKRLVTLFAVLFPFLAEATLTKCPTGFYALFDSGALEIDENDPIGDPLIDRDYLDGYRLRTVWQVIQPDTPSGPAIDSVTYDWSMIDNARNKCAAHGKKLGISIGIGRNCPNWVYALGAYKFLVDPEDNSLANAEFWMPLPWDPVYRAKLDTFIHAMSLKYANDPVITYIAITGYQQLVENRLINNVDASVTFTDGNVTNSGAFAKITSSTAHFTTATGKKPLIGQVIFDNEFDNSTTENVKVFKAGSAVCGIAEGCPADPIDTEVWINKTALITGTNKKGHLVGWTIGFGDEYKLNQKAIADGYSDVPPGKGEIFSGRTWTPCCGALCGGTEVCTGFAGVRAYLPAVKSIFDQWVLEFPDTPVVLTGAAPFTQNNPWSQQVSSALKDYLQTFPNGGYMVASLYAICEEDYTNTYANVLTPKLDQAIYAVSRPDTYKDGVCEDGSPVPANLDQRVRDQAQSAAERGDWSYEAYYNEMASLDPLVQSAWREKRGMFLSRCSGGGGEGGSGGKTRTSARKGLIIIR